MWIQLNIKKLLARAFPRYAVLAGGLAALAFLALLNAGTTTEARLGPATTEGRPCEPEPTDESIVYGDLITCEINPIGDTDVFRFYGKNGEKVIVQSVRQSGNGTPCIELFRPSGIPYGSGACTLGQIEEKLDKTGIHTIEVTEFVNDQTVAYALSLERVSPPSPNAFQVSYGQSRDNQIDPVGDVDLFYFRGTSGDSVVVQAVAQSGSGTPCIELFRPGGIPYGYGACTLGRIEEKLDKTGTHTILVTEFLNNQTVGYRLTLQCVSGSCAPTPKAQVVGYVHVKGKPLARVPVILKAFGGRTWRAMTDASGRYAFRKAPSGLFSIIVQPQIGLTEKSR